MLIQEQCTIQVALYAMRHHLFLEDGSVDTDNFRKRNAKHPYFF